MTQYAIRSTLLDELVDFVLDKTTSPVDPWAVAAILESRGLRDVDAVERFGKRDIFDLADAVYARCRERLAAAPPSPEPELALHWYQRLGRLVHFYLRGTFFAMPMAVQIVAVLLLGYALWASLYFNEFQATAVAVGTILSFMVTGGFVQAMGRLGLFYTEQGSYILARQVCHHLMRWGLIAVLAVGAAWYVTNLLSPYYPQSLLLISLTYYLLLGMLWLVLAVLYTLQQRLAILLTTTVGVGVIQLIMRSTSWSVYVAHWLGLSTVNLLALLWGYRVLSQRARRVSGELRLARLPRLSVLAYVAAPYFAYGVLYFGFLFLDRLIGWSAGREPLPLPIWFRTAYELGVDWALLSLILTIALLEYTVHEFAAIIIPAQKRFSAFRIAEHNRFFTRFYLRQLLLLAGIAVLSAILTYKGVLWFRRYDQIRQVRDFFASPITFQVFYWAVVGYSLTVWGLMNDVFFFSLSRPAFALHAIGLAIAANASIGFVLSRILDYWYSVVGLTIGAFVFAAVTTRHAVRIFRNMDYYYYSAY